MIFKGWQKTSLVEYPGRVSTVLFCGGCNLRCPFCYNTELVLDPARIPDLRSEDVLTYLEAARPLREAVIVTGGEPTLQDELPVFLSAVKKLGYLAGLETNGTRSGMLARLLDEDLLDFVAMDVKAPLEPDCYARAAGVEDGRIVGEVERSVRMLLSGSVEYELRTTVVPGIHGSQDIPLLGRQLAGAERYVIQQFVPDKTLDAELQTTEAFSRETLERWRDAVGALVGSCEVRNA